MTKMGAASLRGHPVALSRPEAATCAPAGQQRGRLKQPRRRPRRPLSGHTSHTPRVRRSPPCSWRSSSRLRARARTPSAATASMSVRVEGGRGGRRDERGRWGGGGKPPTPNSRPSARPLVWRRAPTRGVVRRRRGHGSSMGPPTRHRCPAARASSAALARPGGERETGRDGRGGRNDRRHAAGATTPTRALGSCIGDHRRQHSSVRCPRRRRRWVVFARALSRPLCCDAALSNPHAAPPAAPAGRGPRMRV